MKSRESEPPDANAVQAPWSRHGWYSDAVARDPDHVVPDVVLRDPLARFGVWTVEGTPGASTVASARNPYLTIAVIPFFFGAGVFLLTQEANGGGLILGILGWFGIGVSALSLLIALVRVPGWHRARRLAREHARATGTPFPRQLRWYN